MTGPSTDLASERAPSVLVVLVVQNAGASLRATLSSLAAQTYPRMGVVAVDNGSTDGSVELLTQALGARRVRRVDGDPGLPASLRAAMEIPAVQRADYLLVMHDDTALDPDAVARLVDAAIGIGLEDVGIVGPKVVDWDEPRSLREVGRSADRFGHPYTPLQAGEIDQGQFDRVIEVLCVSSSAMLISREAWQRAGLFDERLGAVHQDLDLCWRARLAGFRVVMTPNARARHRATSSVGDGVGQHHRRSERSLEDRAAITAMLKNYSLLSLAWLLPLDLALAFVRLVYLTLTRRFEGALDLLAAWGWNVVHLPGTLSRRVRAQSVRRVPDRQLRRFMESAGLRLPRWFETADLILGEQREIDVEDEDLSPGRRLRDRTMSLVGSHPVIVASFLALVVGAVAGRGLFGPEPLHGGALPAFPASWKAFFAELDSGFRTTGLGGSAAASPALGALGALSWLAFGSTAIAEKVILGAGPVLAAVIAYRALVRLTGRPGAAVLGAVTYGLSGLVLWSFSEGRIDLLVALAVLPALAERLEVGFGRHALPDGRWRFVAGLAVTLAVGMAFVPGVLLAFGVLIVVHAVFGASRGRGLGLATPAVVGAALLLFPFLPTIASNGGLGSRLRTTDLAALGRLTLGGGPGTWVIAAFLPVAALLGYALVGPEHRGLATRAVVAAVAALALAWLSAGGYLPDWAADAPVYVALAAVCETFVVGAGLSSVLSGIGRESFGLRQVGTILLTVVVGGGLLLQSATAMVGGWAVGGRDALPPAWAVVASNAHVDDRVLWVGADTGRRFVSPGGDPAGIAPAGGSSLRYGLTDPRGTSAFDIGRSLTGGGASYLRDALEQILAGQTVHGGALLAPLGVAFVVAERGDLPSRASAIFDAQVDLDRQGTTGLVVYRNAVALPPAAVVPQGAAFGDIASSGALARISLLRNPGAVGLDRAPGGWSGTAAVPGTLYLATGFNPDWQLVSAGHVVPREAFGWATSFDVPAGPVRVRFGAQWERTLETIVLALLWGAALWVTRKPVGR